MSSNGSIRPFQIDIPEEPLQELRRRVAAARWPDRETVSDRTQGAQLAKVQELVHYWATDYDWRKLARRTRLISSCPHCPVSASQPGRRRQAGTWEQPELFAGEMRAAFRPVR